MIEVEKSIGELISELDVWKLSIKFGCSEISSKSAHPTYEGFVTVKIPLELLANTRADDWTGVYGQSIGGQAMAIARKIWDVYDD